MNLRTIASILGLAVVGVGVAWWRGQITTRALTAEVTKLSRQNAELRGDLKQATRQAEDLGRHAVELDSQLGSAKSRTTATESKHAQLYRELNETKSQLTEREQREVALMAELATLRQKVAGAPSPIPTNVATAAPDPPATTMTTTETPAIDASVYNRRIAELERQLTELLTRALAEPAAAPALELAPVAAVNHQVVRVGPRDSFVVLDLGTDHGTRVNDVISVRHGTSEVARVQISDARLRFSVAQVLPGTLKGQLQTGDLVVFTH